MLAAFLSWWLVREAGAMWFWRNPRFLIRSLDIRVAGRTITDRHVREYMGLSEGTNLFSFNMRRAHDEFCARTPVVRSVVMERRLPDTLSIEVRERTVMARIGRSPAWGVDREGWLFPLRAIPRDLPVLTGLPEGRLKAGVRLEPRVTSALDIIETCNRTRLGDDIRIASIDVRSPEFLELSLAGGERVRLAWTGMEQPATPESLAALERKLQVLAQALRAAELRGRRIANLDLTFTDQYIPAQEY